MNYELAFWLVSSYAAGLTWWMVYSRWSRNV